MGEHKRKSDFIPSLTHALTGDPVAINPNRVAQHAVTQSVRLFPWLDPREHKPRDNSAKIGAGSRDASAGSEALAQVERQRAVLAELSANIRSRDGRGGYDGQKLYLDTETTGREFGQAMRFGIAREIGMSYDEIMNFKRVNKRWPTREETEAVFRTIVVYRPEFLDRVPGGSPKNAKRILIRYAKARGYVCMSREKFCREVVFRLDTVKGDIPLPKMVIGHNLTFDLGAMALEWGLARGDMYGAISLRLDNTLVPVRDEKHDRIEKLNAISPADPRRRNGG
jgi:hypothetical protein